MSENYNKLVRDRIPEILDKKGISYKKRIANNKEYKKELIKKFIEETQEFIKDKSVGELADVLEVVYAIKKIPDYANVDKIQREKKKERGGFDKRIILKGKKS